MSNQKPVNAGRTYILLNISALVLSLLIVFLSTHIRLGEAGLGCDPWPGCYAQRSLADGVKGLAIPDTGFRLFRSFHRGIASLLGLNILLILVMAVWKRKALSPVLPVMMMMVVVFLSVLGITTPTRSLPIVTLGNILGGIALAGLIWAHLVQLRGAGDPRPPLRYLLVALCIQIASGAWASANYTGAACPGLLTCSHTDRLLQNLPGSFHPFRRLALDDDDRLVPDSAASIIQYTHRLLAVGWLVLVIHLFRKLRRTYPNRERAMLAVVILSLAEFSLGVFNVVMDMPLWTNTLHNLLAAGVLFTVISLIFGTGKHARAPRFTASPD